MSIDAQRKDYIDALPGWKKIDDVRKARDLAKYLRKLHSPGIATSELAGDTVRQRQYEDAAVFYNILGFTVRGLIGTMFRRQPTLALPARLQYIGTNSDGRGNGIAQHSRRTAINVLTKGRAGLWVNYPKTNGEVSIAEREKAFATIHFIRPEQIINWSVKSDGANAKLSLVVIKYQHEKIEQYEVKCVDRIKELALDGAGRYFVREWEREENARGIKKRDEWKPVDEPSYPTDASGTEFTEIPFTFVGSENNDHEVDEAPMIDMARVNIGHYRNSADYEDSVFYAGQSQPWMSGMNESYYDLIKREGIRVGSRVMMPVPPGEQFGFATPDPNPLVFAAMKHKVEMMIGLGARFIAPGGQAKTAYEAESERESSHSLLQAIAENVSDAYTRALAWCSRFMGSDQPAEYIIDSDFSDIGATPQLLAAWVKSYIDGAVPESQYIEWMQRQGYFDPTLRREEIAEQLAGDANDGAGGAESQLGEV